MEANVSLKEAGAWPAEFVSHREKKHTKKIDVYSFAIVLWELLTTLTPFGDMTSEQAAFAVCQKVISLEAFDFTENVRPPLHASCPSAFCQLISRCWSDKPERRLDFDEIVSILERYAERVEEDPDFFKWYEP
ncbi:serine/threonine-protein kinase HT1-like protein [Tanacetum coccineum]